MIQTKTPIIYGDRDEREGIIKIEVRPLETKLEGINFIAIDWDITKSLTEPWKSKPVYYDAAKINYLDDMLEAQYAAEFANLTSQEKYWAKLIIGVMLDTTVELLPNGKTIYRRNPEDWEYSPESIALFPFLANQ